MWIQLAILATFVSIVITEMGPPGIERSFSDGVTSRGYRVVYGDEDLTVINEVVGNMEKNDILKAKASLNEAIQPLPAGDVKCLMSADRYCSVEMRKVKAVLIQALKNDCEKCSNTEKDTAGRVAASMMTYDPVGWKLFLTRSALELRTEKKSPKPDQTRLKPIGEPEIVSSKYRYTMPGVKVRVKRYYAEKLP
ncbi:uncharacterized protein LOC135079900 [Ostrinia nubilalis]|uniref:uncharacterized protein LOC135079900 n=1 Tax=Ostrinia nubilalis TaxID=29057 RepID=UPI0030823997